MYPFSEDEASNSQGKGKQIGYTLFGHDYDKDETEQPFSHFKNHEGNQEEEQFEHTYAFVDKLLIDDTDNDTELNQVKEGGFQQDEEKEQIGTTGASRNDSKLKAIMPRPKLVMKKFDNKLSTAKFKAPKQTFLKDKFKKGLPSIVNDSSIQNRSIETYANTEDGKQEFEYPNYIPKENQNIQANFEQDNNKDTTEMESGQHKPQMKSRLSLKSKAYINRAGNLNSEMGERKMSYPSVMPSYHRHSLPKKPVGMGKSMYHYTPSTNYTIPSSDEKTSLQMHMHQNIPISMFPPSPFGKMQSSSHDNFVSMNNAYYIQMARESMTSPNNLLNNTAPLPDMSSFNRGISYSPDLNLQQQYYYGMNMASTGGISTNSDYLHQPLGINYYGNMGSTWPKIPQMLPAEPVKFSTIPVQQNYKPAHKGYEKEKPVYELKIDRIISGKDKRTTLMIKNIPNKYNQAMLTAEIDLNHQGLYDIIYLPIDPKNQCNCGYGFINVVHPLVILSLYLEFNGKSWRNFNSDKICILAYGRLQGKDQLLSQLEGSGVMQQSDPTKKPLLLDTIQPSDEFLDKIVCDFKSAYDLP